MKMLKRTSILLLGVVALIAMLTPCKIIAQEPPCIAPDCLDVVDYKIRIIRDINGLFPTYDANENPIYNYRVDCVNNTVNFIDMTIPREIVPGNLLESPPDNYANIETSVSKTSPPPFPNPDPELRKYWLFPEGKGDGTFGKDIDTLHVLKLKIYQKPTFYFSVKIKNQSLGANNIAMWLRTGIGPRSGVILGPSFPIPNFTPITFQEEKTLGTTKILIVRDPGTWCATKVFRWVPGEGEGGGIWEEIPQATDVKIGEQYLLNCGTLDGNQKCSECLVYGEASEGQCYMTSGGKTFIVPCPKRR